MWKKAGFLGGNEIQNEKAFTILSVNQMALRLRISILNIKEFWNICQLRNCVWYTFSMFILLFWVGLHFGI